MNRYEEIAQDVIDKINNNQLIQGMQLKNEQELCQEYKCSKITIKKALTILTKKGIVFRQRGSGSFVNANAKFWLSFNETNLLGHARGNKHLYEIRTQVILFEIIIPSKNISTLLNIKNTYTYHFKRIRYHDGIPSLLEESYVPLHVAEIKESDLENSLFAIIEKNNEIQSIHKVITMQKASKDVAKHLEICDDEIVARYEEVNYLSSSKAFEYSIIYQNYKDFNFYSVIQNN